MLKPYYQKGDITIYHGDCLKILPQLDKVDLVITSPQYNLGNDHHTNKKRHNPYNDHKEEWKYQAEQCHMLEILYGITTSNASVFYNHKNRIRNGVQISPYNWIDKTTWLIKQEIVWWNGSPNFDKIRFYPQTERIYWLAKKGNVVINNKAKLTDVWKIDPVGSNGLHTRQYPIAIPENIIGCFENGLILDPYMGGGTTLIAAKNLNRKAIGIEIEEKYCEIAAKRLSQEVFQFNNPPTIKS